MPMLTHESLEVWREVIREPVSLVYFFQRAGSHPHVIDGDIKIGHTGDFRERRRNLLAKNGPLTLLAAELGGLIREQELHRQFHDLRITRQGEWFRPHAKLLDYVRETAVGGSYPVFYDAPHPSEYLTTWP